MNAIKLLLTEGWRLTKATANLFIFGGIDYFPFFKSQASAMGWKPFPVPMIWRKSLSEGLAPWGRNGPRRTYDPIFFATKGQRGLFSSPTDVLEVKRVHRSERIYGAQKPVDLLMQLIECSTMPGMSVLDPFMGSGSTLAAAKKLDRLATGVEFDKAVADIATNFVFQSDLNDTMTQAEADAEEAALVDSASPLSDSDLEV
jgi:site-specific DNA-methyltransferase (adenine-specific)